MYNDVGSFHKKFDLPVAGGAPHIVPHRIALFRLMFLQEELMELTKGVMKDDLPAIADALVDLVYVALGTAHYYGLPWEALWDEVQRANMKKERAAADGSNSSRENGLDVIKPKGWEPPDISGILDRYRRR
jgi:predicted HAD superfamily Cof-like phosphohydrolase